MERKDFLNEFIEFLTNEVTQRMKEQPKEEKKIERKKLMGIRGIADFLGISPGTVQRMRNRGEFPVYWVGAKMYAYSDELESAINKGGQN